MNNQLTDNEKASELLLLAISYAISKMRIPPYHPDMFKLFLKQLDQYVEEAHKEAHKVSVSCSSNLDTLHKFFRDLVETE